MPYTVAVRGLRGSKDRFLQPSDLKDADLFIGLPSKITEELGRKDLIEPMQILEKRGRALDITKVHLNPDALRKRVLPMMRKRR
jgi:hypothetical protein